MTQQANDLYDAAFGCLLGACVGDAAGATLEMMGRKPTLPEVDRAMTMPGGGVWDVAPGQITDDGELTLCLAQALSKSARFQIEQIAQSYAAWMQSRPFDRGMTISQAFGCVLSQYWQATYDTTSYAEAMRKAADYGSIDSKANGSLMRASPLGIWGYQLEDTKLAHYAQQDSLLSHPNESCCHAVACYAIAISSLMRDFGDHQTAFQRVQQWAERHANPEVQSWLDAAQKNINVPYYPQAGFVKIAFIHAFRHLLLRTNYVDAIRETLSGGGDTDTNTCIVGGLIGAACGAQAIPDEMKEPVLWCDTEYGAHPRPEFLWTTHLEELTKQLVLVGYFRK